MDFSRYEKLRTLVRANFSEQTRALVDEALVYADGKLTGLCRYDGTPLLDHAVAVAMVVISEVGLGRNSTVSAILHDVVRLAHKQLPAEEFLALTADIRDRFGEQVVGLTMGLANISELKLKVAKEQADNFRDLLVSYSEDPRVILIKLADRLEVMRSLEIFPHEKWRKKSWESMNLYAQIAHKLGLYSLKSELEDIALKYLEPKDYEHIVTKLEESADERKAFIARFLVPIEERLHKLGIKYHIKSRTKSIFSIWTKMHKQHVPFEGVYDIFAIRIIIDCPKEQEKPQCWTAYSVVTDFYTPNPNRMRDWISIPKSNGYESLHITVMGPEGKWVEVQIRTERMDEIAERGLAAHWRYKGVKGESGLDEWLTSVREALENSDSSGLETMDQFKLDLYEDEVFVFTPKGDLFKLGKGSTVLDFAFHIHSKLGCKCIGAKVNGKNAQLKQILNSGDQVEIMTSNTQTPKQDWLNIVTTSKARTKIRQALKEMAARQHAFAKETLERKFKNRKIEYDEGTMMRLIKRLGFKVVTDFYQSIADETLDVNDIIDKYLELQKRENDTHDDIVYRSAEGYNLQAAALPEETAAKEDVLVIDQNLKGLDFKLARCCNPIYGDEVFGFVTVSGGIKIHRCDCPNASDLRERFGYRIVKARWAGKSQGTQYPITLRVVGHDDIGIVTNITSIISKETGITLRSIGIDSHDGLFSGTLTIMVGDTGRLEALIKKLRTVKGVKQVSRN